MNVEPEKTKPYSVTSLPRERTANEKALILVLTQKDRKFSDMYLGALECIDHSVNPDRFSQAAHSFRELMEKLLRDMQITYDKTNLKSKMQNLHTLYLEFKKRKVEFEKVNIGRVYEEIEKIGKWQEENIPKKKEIGSGFLNKTKQSGANTVWPDEYWEPQVDEWMAIDNYFQDVSHHQIKTYEQFHVFKERLELFLLNQLSPETFTELSNLDSIIKKGEGR